MDKCIFDIFITREISGKKGARKTFLIQTGRQPAEQHAFFAFRNDRQGTVIKTEIAVFRNFSAPEHITGDHTDKGLDQITFIEKYLYICADPRPVVFPRFRL